MGRHWFAAQRLTVILSVSVVAGPPSAQAAPPLLAPTEIKTFLPAVGITSLAQTKDGLLWVGTSDSLLRFDGHQFVAWPRAPDATPWRQRVRRLAAQKDANQLWVVGGQGDLSVWANPPGYELIKLEPAAPGGSVVHVVDGDRRRFDSYAFAAPHVLSVADAEGSVWFGTNHGLWKMSRNPGGGMLPAEHVKVKTLASNAIGALAFDLQGALWVGTEAGLQVLPKHGLQLQATAIASPVLGVETNAFGDTLVRTHTKFSFFRGGQLVAQTGADSHPSISAGRAGGFWVTSALKVSRLTLVNAAIVELESVPVSNAVAVLEDKEGSLWIGTRAAGLFQRRTRRVWNVGPGQGLGGHAAFCILNAQDGSQWITTDVGLSHVLDGSIENFPSGTGAHEVPGWGLRGIAQTKSGRLFVNSLSNGLLLQTQRGWIRASTVHPMLGPGVSALFVSPKGDLWVGLPKGGLARFPQGELADPQFFSGEQHACLHTPASFATDTQGTLWVGSVGHGLGAIKQGVVTCHKPQAMQKGNAFVDVASLLTTADGSVWMGGQPQGGLVRFKGGRFDRIQGDLPADTIGALVASDGFVWMPSSDHGVFRASLLQMEHAANTVALGGADTFAPTRWSANDGLNNEVCMTWNQPAGAVDRHKRFWVPTQLGVSVVDAPERLGTHPSQVSWDQLHINGRTRELSKALGPGPIDFAISLISPVLMHPESLALRVQLRGRDSGWVRVQDRKASWSQLPPGRYQLAAQASMAGSSIMTSATYTFVVRKPFFRTVWFALLLAAVALLAFAVVLLLRDRQLKEKFATIQNERLSLARDLHDGLAQGFTAMGLLIDSLEQRTVELSAPVRLLVQRARHVLDQFQADTRRTIWELRSQHATVLSLAEAIDKAVETARFSAKVDVSIAGTPQLTSSMLHELPLIVREATTNAIRHGKASAISIAIDTRGAGVTLTITDNGEGLPQNSETTERARFGVQGMHERAQRINGALAISDIPSGGVRVVVDIPPATSH